MLVFLRKYQRFFLSAVAFTIISSFIFFGVFSTYTNEPAREDAKIGSKMDGSALMLFELQDLSRFIATDREDPIQERGFFPNLCNDGVIRYDFLQSKLAEILVEEYLPSIKADLEEKLEKVKRYRSYVHPEAPFIKAEAVWQRFLPDLNTELAILQHETEPGLVFFTKLAKLYELQRNLPPETLKRILLRQSQQYPALPLDPQLVRGDLALFGFHTVSDWFGRNFLDLVSQFILNAAIEAESKGYKVSFEEAKGDLIHRFQESVQKMAAGKATGELNFHQHLRSLGFDERSACAVWQKVLLFRKYFEDIGNTAFVDRFSYREFLRYSQQVAVVQKYHFPIQLKNAQDVAEYKAYLQAVAVKAIDGIPTAFYSLDEIEKRYPQLVETTYRAKIAEVSKKEIGLKASLKQISQWAAKEENWEGLKKKFSLPDAGSEEKRLAVLNSLNATLRLQVDSYIREALVDENPAWVEEALQKAALEEKTWSVSGNSEPILKEKGIYYKIEGLEKVEDKHVLTFAQARPALAALVPKTSAPFTGKDNPLIGKVQEAFQALQKNPEDSKWIQSGKDPLRDQFKFIGSLQEIKRSSKESWMKEQAFFMLPNVWSPIQVDESGEIVFFYLKERKTTEAPILDQIPFGKQTLAADAKAWVAERLLQKIKKEKAIVIPVKREN